MKHPIVLQRQHESNIFDQIRHLSYSIFSFLIVGDYNLFCGQYRSLTYPAQIQAPSRSFYPSFDTLVILANCLQQTVWKQHTKTKAKYVLEYHCASIFIVLRILHNKFSYSPANTSSNFWWRFSRIHEFYEILFFINFWVLHCFFNLINSDFLKLSSSFSNVVAIYILASVSTSLGTDCRNQYVEFTRPSDRVATSFDMDSNRCYWIWSLWILPT